jgi:hypothetical protein
MTIKAPAVPVVVECKYCGLGPLYWAQSEQGWILLSVVPGTLYTVIDATLTPAPTVYRRHFCDPLARTEWQVRQAEAQRVDDVNVARDMAYVEQERRDNEAYLNTPRAPRTGRSSTRAAMRAPRPHYGSIAASAGSRAVSRA